MRMLWMIVLGGALAGCAVPERNPPVAVTVPTPVCTNDRQCSAMWARVPSAIEMVTRMRVRTYSETMIDTFAPSPSMVAMYGRVVKRPISSGGYSIDADLQCSSQVLCDRLYGQAMNLFNTAINGAGKPFANRR